MSSYTEGLDTHENAAKEPSTFFVGPVSLTNAARREPSSLHPTFPFVPLSFIVPNPNSTSKDNLSLSPILDSRTPALPQSSHVCHLDLSASSDTSDIIHLFCSTWLTRTLRPSAPDSAPSLHFFRYHRSNIQQGFVTTACAPVLKIISYRRYSTPTLSIFSLYSGRWPGNVLVLAPAPGPAGNPATLRIPQLPTSIPLSLPFQLIQSLTTPTFRQAVIQYFLGVDYARHTSSLIQDPSRLSRLNPIVLVRARAARSF